MREHELSPFRPGMLVRYEQLPGGCRFDETAAVHDMVLAHPGVGDVVRLETNEHGNLLVLVDVFRATFIDAFPDQVFRSLWFLPNELTIHEESLPIENRGTAAAAAPCGHRADCIFEHKKPPPHLLSKIIRYAFHYD